MTTVEAVTSLSMSKEGLDIEVEYRNMYYTFKERERGVWCVDSLVARRRGGRGRWASLETLVWSCLKALGRIGRGYLALFKGTCWSTSRSRVNKDFCLFLKSLSVIRITVIQSNFTILTLFSYT